MSEHWEPLCITGDRAIGSAARRNWATWRHRRLGNCDSAVLPAASPSTCAPGTSPEQPDSSTAPDSPHPERIRCPWRVDRYIVPRRPNPQNQPFPSSPAPTTTDQLIHQLPAQPPRAPGLQHPTPCWDPSACHRPFLISLLAPAPRAPGPKLGAAP